MPHVYHQRRSSESRLAAILDYLGDPTGLEILDLGALDGWFSHKLAAAGAQVTAADDSTTLTGGPGVTCINGRLTATEIRKLGTFDAALCLSVLHHLPAWRATLKALLAVAPLVFIETSNPDETLPKARAQKHSTAIHAAVEKAGGGVLAETPGYDKAFSRPLWVIDQRFADVDDSGDN